MTPHRFLAIVLASLVAAATAWASATSPTLIVSAARAVAADGRRSVTIEGTFDFENAVQVGYPLQLVVFQGTRFVRFPAVGVPQTGETSLLADGRLDAAELAGSAGRRRARGDRRPRGDAHGDQRARGAAGRVHRRRSDRAGLHGAARGAGAFEPARAGAAMKRVVALLALLLAAGRTPAATIFDGDPVDPVTGRAYAMLPGVPLILPQPDGKFDPPIVVPGTIGDVDLVVRAAATGIGPAMPPPVASPPVAVAGGVHVAPGSEIPFTVIASTGGTGIGAPLGGTSLDGIPVVVAAFADLDGDGIVGPTAADGSADDARELQEAVFLVGRQVAVFSGGIATGSLAVWKGAPASAGGLTVVLTAMAYVGPFRPGFFEGVVPDGPGVATLLPFFPRLDPKRVIEGDGRGGAADPDERLGFELEPAFDDAVDRSRAGHGIRAADRRHQPDYRPRRRGRRSGVARALPAASRADGLLIRDRSADPSRGRRHAARGPAADHARRRRPRRQRRDGPARPRRSPRQRHRSGRARRSRSLPARASPSSPPTATATRAARS